MSPESKKAVHGHARASQNQKKSGLFSVLKFKPSRSVTPIKTDDYDTLQPWFSTPRTSQTSTSSAIQVSQPYSKKDPIPLCNRIVSCQKPPRHISTGYPREEVESERARSQKTITDNGSISSPTAIPVKKMRCDDMEFQTGENRMS